ncbi:uncharacterized protein LOC124805898 [Hydra vulgaris]|uniref:uncharacterized protein LOC124805898 n=1 Tax=Hydra vulgaris TaxID=6087 RepID=UPI001F5FD6EA|nr:uncharacterized protein LOC124805898 [Hydra vulgaris]
MAATVSEIKKMLTQMFNEYKKEIEKILKQQEKNFVDILSSNLKIIKDRLGLIENKSADNVNKINKLEKELNELKESLNFHEHLIEQKVKTVSNNLEKESSIQNINEKNRILEDRSRQNNLRIEGITESVNETWEETEDNVLKLFSKNLKVNEVEIERAHRTGYKKDGKTRTLILKLLRFKDKAKILKEAHRLKGLNIYINEDYSRETSIIRKKLFSEAKLRRENGENVAVRYDKIIKLKSNYTKKDLSK